MMPPDHAKGPFPDEIVVPFNKPSLAGRELEYIAESVRLGHIAGDGPFTARCQELLEQLLGVPRVFLTTSGTHALEMAALLCDVESGDEVIVPSFSFVSTAAAFALRGARIVFADIRADTYNLDESQLSSLVTERTRVIVPVHYAGVGCEMEVVGRVASSADVSVVEDAAHSLLASYRGRFLGTIGRMGILSFHETKNVISGEGGALLLNDPALIERAENVWHKGTNRASFFRGEVDQYSWVDLGSSFAPSDLVAAFLLAQLEEHEAISRRRRFAWDYYLERLTPWATSHGVELPTIPPHCESSHHLFSLLFPASEDRDRALQTLKERGIVGTFHYVPLHASPVGRRVGTAPLGCPVSEGVAARILRLPLFNDLDQQAQDLVVEVLEGAFT